MRGDWNCRLKFVRRMDMAMNRTSPEDLLRIKSQELGLNPDQFSLLSTEGFACALRRAAGYWLKGPPDMTPQRHVANANDVLSMAQPFHSEVPGLSILDPDQPVRYYRGRWTEPKNQSGRYVGRRKQAYGADLWCYVEMA